MARRQSRITRSLGDKLEALDDHTYNLRSAMSGMLEPGSLTAHVRSLASELRVLVCYSSHTEGLLWRLADELGVSDEVTVRAPGPVDPDHELSRGLAMCFIPVSWPDEGDPRLPLVRVALRRLLKEFDAIYVADVAGRGITHEDLIKRVAQQMGGAHESDGLDAKLFSLRAVSIGGLRPYERILLVDAELTLHVAERVLVTAGETVRFRRKRRHSYGESTILLRMGYHRSMLGSIGLLEFRSRVGDIAIACEAHARSVHFLVRKHGALVGDALAPHPPDWHLAEVADFTFSYSSQDQLRHTRTNGVANDDGIPCEVGFLQGTELRMYGFNRAAARREVVFINAVLLYARILRSEDYAELSKLPADLHGLWIRDDEASERGAFY